jgi:hypothetical protein
LFIWCQLAQMWTTGRQINNDGRSTSLSMVTVAGI